MSQPALPLASVPPPAAAAPGTAGSTGAESSQQEQQEHVESPELNTSTMSDEQIEKTLSGEPAAAPAAPAAAPAAPAKETPAAQPKLGEPASQPAAPAPAPAEILLAGKYKSTGDLKKAILEITKPLGYSPKVIERLVAAAEKTGDWKPVEETYKELDTALSRGEKAPPAAPSAPAAPDAKPPANEVERAVEQEVYRVSVDEAYRRVSESPVAAELAELGVGIPKTKQEWDRLKLDYPFVAMRFEQQFTQAFHSARNQVNEYRIALQEQPAHIEAAKAAAKQQITDIAKEFKLEGIDDAKITALIEEALKAPQVYEMKKGVQYVRADGIRDYFITSQWPTISKSIRLSSELDGRSQAVKDLDEMRKKNITSISGAPLPGTKGKVEIEPDVDDERVRARMSDEELNKKINEG